MRSRGNSRRTPVLFAVVVASAMAASLPALRNGLFWDDAIVLARQVPAMGGPWGAFFPPHGLPQFIPSYYRPVVFLTLLADRAVWGSSPFGHHLDVWMLHALTSGLFFLLMHRVIGGSGGAWAAFAAGLLFSVHPVHAEAVAWIMGRADVLAALFTVAGLLAVTSLARREGPLPGPSVLSRGNLVPAAVVFTASALALLSKESAIVMPALAVFVLVAAIGVRPGASAAALDAPVTALPRKGGRRLGRAALIAVIAASAGVVLALGLRMAAGTGAVDMASSSVSAEPELAPRLVRAVVFALRRLVWPWPAPVFHAQIPPVGIAGLAASLLFLALTTAACLSSRTGRAAALFTGAALLPALAPALTHVSLSPVADRYLYMPSLGACWMAGAVLARLLPDLRSAGAILAGAVLALWIPAGAVTTFRAVASYRDDATFWSAALVRSPSDPFVVMKHGQYLAGAGRFTEAESEMQRALELGGESFARSTRTILLDNLGDIALRQGHLDAARSWLDRAVESGPGYALAHLHLARWHRTKALSAAASPDPADRTLAAEESRLAAASVDTAIRLEPMNTEALLLRADLALDRSDKPAAIAAIGEALRYMPAGPDRSRIEAALRALRN